MPAGHHRKKTPPGERLRRLRSPAGFALVLALAVPVAASAPASTTGGSAASTTTAVAAPKATTATVRPDVLRSEIRAASRLRDRLRRPAPSRVATPPPKIRLVPRWTTPRLNVRAGAGERSRLLTVLDSGAKVLVTGTVRGPWAQVAWKGRPAWVRRAYLVRSKPRVAAFAAPAGVSGAPCPDGSAVESGLQPNAVKLYRAVCAAFPAVSAWGGRSGSGNHGAGRALDIMCSGSLGDAIASYARAHASALGVSEVIWSQRIWTVQRSSEGWRPMESRGSATANHYDHVHVSLY